MNGYQFLIENCCCMVPKAAYQFVVSRNSFLNDVKAYLV